MQMKTTNYLILLEKARGRGEVGATSLELQSIFNFNQIEPLSIYTHVHLNVVLSLIYFIRFKEVKLKTDLQIFQDRSNLNL